MYGRLKDLITTHKEEKKFLEEYEKTGKLDCKVEVSFRIHGKVHYIRIYLEDQNCIDKTKIIDYIKEEIKYTKKLILELKREYDKDNAIMKEIEEELKHFKG